MNHNDFNMSPEDYFKKFWDMLRRLDLMPDEKLDAEADRIIAKRKYKFTPLEDKNDDSGQTKAS